DDEVAWWVDSGATIHVCKDLRWFQVCKSIKNGSFEKMGNIATEPIKGIGRVLLTFTSGKTLCLDNIELPFLKDQFQEDPPPEVPMADNRTIAELLQAPIEGYEDAIVIPEIAANNFELKHSL
nr:zinc finger, CCHC-type [Tanacetum cinerariifolium]